MIRDKKEQSVRKKTKQKKGEEEAGERKVSKKPKFGLSNLKSQIEHTVNAKKILHFIKKNTKTIPHLLTKQQSKLLIPRLQKIALEKDEPHTNRPQIHFTDAQDLLTQSMVQFRKEAVEAENEEVLMIEMQTKKCYKSIPEIYFKPDLSTDQLGRSLKLTKNPKIMKENVYELIDYSDEVQFNINQQVGAKIKIFTHFVGCMDSLQYMVLVNTRKIAQARKHTSILRDIIVSRSIRINKSRLKKQRLELILEILNYLKKMKEIQGKLYDIIETGSVISHDVKSKSGALYGEYCEIHNEVVQKFCCKGGRGLCKYWDLAYFVERGFQDNFMRMMKNYIFQVVAVNSDLDSFKRAFSVNKKNFSTTPANVFSMSNASFTSSFALDESYEVDYMEQVELLVKENVEKQISNLFQSGMQHYSFSTDVLCSELTSNLERYVSDFFKQTLSEVQSATTITLKQLIIDEKKEKKKDNFFGSEKFSACIQKISWSKFQKILQIVYNRFQYINIRIFSVTNKLIHKSQPLEKDQTERFQVICTYMTQIALLSLTFSDEKLAKIINARLKKNPSSKAAFKSKGESIKQFDLQTENMKKIIKHCKKWCEHINYMKNSFPFLKTQIEESFLRSYRDMDCSDKWSPLMFAIKGDLVRETYENLHKSIISRELKNNLEEDSWQIIEVDQQIYDILGYIMGGKEFLLEQERENRNMISKSLLLEKNVSEIDPEPKNQKNSYNRNEYSSKFRVNPMYVTIGSFRFKLTSSTEEMIRFLKHYLELYDQAGEKDIDKKYELHGRITEVILMYNQYVKDLILKSEALKLGKIAAKSIGAKHLVIAFVQLQIIDLIFCGEVMQTRIDISPEECAVMRSKLNNTKTEIKTKFMKILEMRIMITIESLNYKEDSILTSDSLMSIPKNIRSSVELFEDFMLEEKQILGFLNMSNLWVNEISNKMQKGKSKQRKLKVVNYLIGELSCYFDYMPQVKSALFSLIS